MDSRTQERVERWDSRPFNGGYDGLSDLAAADFSGAVTVAGTWLFMLNGRIVGVVDGDIEDFENASGTTYDAPHPSLPLLCSMEERGGETRAKYYTNETPLREVDRTLQDGSFTGYVELSENVLSGDYYAVYYGGRRMAAAYIGNAERLLTGDEAFERADGEVGIYEVIDVEVEVTDVPGTEPAADPAGAESTPDAGTAANDAGMTPDAAASSGSPGDASSTTPDAASTTQSDAPSSSTSAADDASASGDGPAIDDAASAIESLEVGGLDESTDDLESDDSPLGSDIDLTDDPAGITTSEPVESDSEPTGITDVPGIESEESVPDAGADSAVDAAVDPDDGDAGTGDAAAPTDDLSDLPIDEAESGTVVDDGRDGSEDLSEESGVEDATATARAAESAVEPESAASTADPEDASAVEPEEASPSPDLAEVEAAAEELDRNDISWVEEEDDEDDAGAEPADGTEEEDDDFEERFQEEAQWREARSIPSIDPDNTETPSEPTAESQSSSGGRGRSSGADRQSADRESAADGAAGSQTRSDEQSNRSGGQSQAGSERGDRRRREAQERIEDLTERLETAEEHRDALREKAQELKRERDQLRSKNQELVSTVERLQSRIEELETELQRARNAASAAGSQPANAGGVDARTELQPDRALSETNLFVRYASKSNPTLKTAHDGDADREEVARNLRLEHHTQFDAADVAVEGQPYEEFLTSTMEYRFVDWLMEMVLYEIRDTGNADGLGDLYDAIPRIDRAELHSSISLEDDEMEEVPDEISFDVVAYDKMGNPLVVANLNDSRSPAPQGMLEEMEADASAVKANYPDLAAAIVVTSSYFEPGALEIAEEATSGGFLSRGSKLSYVNLSRKEGYHLCLVESRSEGFHMNVPEL